MTTATLFTAKGLFLAFMISLGVCMAGCNQNHERIEEREHRDKAAKAAKKNTSADSTTVTQE